MCHLVLGPKERASRCNKRSGRILFARCGSMDTFRERKWSPDDEGATNLDQEECEGEVCETDMQYIVDMNEDAEDEANQDEYIPPDEPDPEPPIFVVSPPQPQKGMRQLLLLKKDKEGRDRPAYKTIPRPDYPRLKPKPKSEKKYKQKTIGPPPATAKKTKQRKKKLMVDDKYKQQTLDDCREVVVQDEFNLRARGEQRHNDVV